MGDMKIIVAGCVAAQESEALLRRVPEVDLVMGPHHANRLSDLLEQVGSDRMEKLLGSLLQRLLRSVMQKG